MKTLLPLLLLGSLAVTARASDSADELPPAPHGKSFKLVWHDEFEGDKLDESKWTYRPDGKRKGGWWSREAISLDGDGHLVITTFMDGDKPTDGCITTQGKFEHAFGYARSSLRKVKSLLVLAFLRFGSRARAQRSGARNRNRHQHHTLRWTRQAITFHRHPSQHRDNSMQHRFHLRVRAPSLRD